MMTGTQPLLQLSGVNKSFGPVHVLRGVDLSVYAGQVTALVGDNGAGKSTLIKGIAGIHSFDSGEYLFEGKPVNISEPKQANALGIEVVLNRGVGTTQLATRSCVRLLGLPVCVELPRADDEAADCGAGREIRKRRSRLRARLAFLAGAEAA